MLGTVRPLGYARLARHAITAETTHSLKAESVVLRGDVRIPFHPFYGAVPPGDPLAVIGSSGFVEIAANQCNAPRKPTELRTESEVIIS
jgi:S-adenosylmethionine hydrolase